MIATQFIRAVYTEGQFRLLDPVALFEGQEVHLMVLPNQDHIRAILSDLLAVSPDLSVEALDEEALAHEIEEGFRGQPPLSDTIIAERREGP
jgi:predicted DNA-binding antitoxin AbrB/MazE fold protein